MAYGFPNYNAVPLYLWNSKLIAAAKKLISVLAVARGHARVRVCVCLSVFEVVSASVFLSYQ